MKKLVAILMVLALMCAGMTVCAAEETDPIIKGELYMPMMDEAEFGSVLDSVIVPADEVPETELIYFDSLNAMILALQSSRIGVMNVPKACADYLVANNPDTYMSNSFMIPAEVRNTLSMGVLESNADLLAKLNDAIAAIKTDGTMDALVAKYVDGVIAGDEPEKVDIPTIDGADTIRVVVTGDLPPYDYVSADGTAAGFNVALLVEISARANLNIELITSDAASRAALLTSGRADVVFWMRTHETTTANGEVVHVLSENPEGLLITEGYIEDELVEVRLAE